MNELEVKVIVKPANKGWKTILKQIIEWGTKAAEFLMGMQAVGYGIWLLLPFPTFSIDAYKYMKSWASEDSWGFALILAGLFQIVGLFIHNEMTLTWRKAACIIMLWLFSVIAISAVLYSYYITGVISFGSVALFELLVFFKLVSKRGIYV